MNSKYLLIPISIAVVFFYLVTYFLSKSKVINTASHRKLWNTVLLITFLVSGLLGLLLVVQINYKLKIPYLKQILSLHVDFGIGMALVAFLHIFWHLKYFKNIVQYGWLGRSAKSKNLVVAENQNLSIPQIVQGIKQISFDLKTAVIVLGFSSLVTQIILLREFLSIFYGNELIVGVVLANWFLLTGLGAFLGKQNLKLSKNIAVIVVMQVLLGIIPFITAFAMNYLRNIIFPTGSLISLFSIIVVSFGLLLPFCLLSGLMFTVLSRYLSQNYKQNLIPVVYSVETAGSILGGLLFNLVLVFIFKSFQSLLIIMVVNLVAAFLLSNRFKRKIIRYSIVILGAVLIIPAIFIDFDWWTKTKVYKNQTIVAQKETPYSSLLVTKSAGQINFFENGALLFSINEKKDLKSNSNMAVNEEMVHYTMVQHIKPERILLVSGGMGGIINELLKYDVKSLDYVEINPAVIALGKQFMPDFDKQKVNIINQDARRYIKNTSNTYDIALINLPEPTTTQLNRYFTIEFYRELKNKLNHEAVITTSLQSTNNYMSDEAKEINSTLYNTLKQAFRNVIILSGEKNYFIASDKLLTKSVVNAITQSGLVTEYVGYYTDDMMLEQFNQTLMAALDSKAPVNHDFEPVSYYRQIKYWMSYFSLNYWIGGLVIAVMLILFLRRSSAISFGMFTGGFTASSIEMLLIVALQIISGYVYYLTGLLFTVFMLGLATGALLQQKFFKHSSRKTYFTIQIALAIFALVTPLIIILVSQMSVHTVIATSVIFILTFLVALLVGTEFATGAKLLSGETSAVAGTLYSADLFGAALGSLLVCTFLIPVLGYTKLYILIALVNVVSALTLIKLPQKGIFLTLTIFAFRQKG